jgi:protein ImuB
MAFLEGDDRMPLRPYVPCEVPEERAELEYGVQAQEALLFVAKGLCDRMALRLQGRALGACRMELVFQLDAALVPEGSERKTTCAMTMPAPLQSAGDLFAVLKARMERVTLAAPALAVTLRVTEMARREGRSRDLFVPEAKADEALPRLAAELAAELGEGRAGVLCLEDTWVPGKRGRLQAYGEQERKRGRRGAGSVREASAVEGEANKESKGGAGSAGREGLLREEGGLEPSRLLPTPEPVEGAWLAQEEAQVRFHLRLEAVEWWAHGLSVRDYATAWMQGKGLAWVEVDRGTGQCRIMGWVD